VATDGGRKSLAGIAAAALVVVGLVAVLVWKARAPKAPAPEPTQAQEEATFSSSAARGRLAKVGGDPSLVGSWRADMKTGDVTVVTNLVLRADGTFEQVIVLPKARITRAGQYAATGGVLRFASVSCQTDAPAETEMLCKSPMYDSSYVLGADDLSVTVHRASGDLQQVRFVRGSGT
jgi:hypothetical protein